MKNAVLYLLHTECRVERIEPRGIREYAVRVCTDVYQSKVRGCDDDTDAFYSHLPKVSEDSTEGLAGPLTQQEIHGALRIVENGKSRGIDGLPIKLFQACWHVIGSDLDQTSL